MKIKLKELDPVYVYSNSNVLFNIENRKQAVNYLKKLVLTIEDEGLLRFVDNQKICKTPQESLVRLLLAIREKYPDFIFKGDGDHHYKIGFEQPDMEYTAYALPCDFLLNLNDISKPLTELAINVLKFFASYNDICFLEESRMFCDDMFIESIEENISSEDVYSMTYQAYKEILDSYQMYIKKIKPMIDKPFRPVKVSDLILEVENFRIHEKFRAVCDLLLRMLQFCRDEVSLHKMQESIISEMDKNADFPWSEGEDVSPVLITETVLFIWPGASRYDPSIDFASDDVISSVNDWAGNYGYISTNIDTQSARDGKLEDALSIFCCRRQYFSKLHDILMSFINMRNLIYNGKLSLQNELWK